MEIRRSADRLISTMEFPILIRRHLYIESGPRLPAAIGLTMPSMRRAYNYMYLRNRNVNKRYTKLNLMFPGPLSNIDLTISMIWIRDYIHSSVCHDSDVIMGAIASQITSLTIVYSTVYAIADQRKHQSSASPAFVRGIHRWPVNSPHKWPVTRKIYPFDDVIMRCNKASISWLHRTRLKLRR